ncbi:hypothetical protein IQK56_26685 [Pseudomonas sp. MAFF 301449]|uniref:4Fe-4S domain-containing protein n=1 Tax=Pseudomonas cyclaminis TaxID=2781239 RepID=A0ABR9SZ49_9PSED|nr:hypothetical protein [Pseudomonas cyclaminis]MBE8603349.1 hypothetical protein [Pseudomonas cyclaminis]
MDGTQCGLCGEQACPAYHRKWCD